MAGGDWEPMLLGIKPQTCRVCGKGLYRNVTLFRGGWSRCTVCDEFVHYSCLVSGKFKFFKVRPRVCKMCRAERELSETTEVVKPTDETAKLAVGS